MALTIPLAVAPALHEMEGGMELKKCRKCGCMDDALKGATLAFGSSDDPDVRALLSEIETLRGRMEPVAYDCIGCKKCWGADATKELGKVFPDIEEDSCGGSSCAREADRPVDRKAAVPDAWPPYAGDYVVGAPGGAVAVCTLSSRDLPALLVAAGEPSVAIAGRCDTENIGVEKVVLNLLANPSVRYLVLCGREAEGHRTGDAFRQLKARGVDASMRVLESASWRPVLKNLTLGDVARFRERVEVVDLVGETDPAVILAAARERAAAAPPPPDLGGASLPSLPSLLSFERVQARAPKGTLRLDRAGFFVVLPNHETGVIVCEHYENNGRLAHVVEGRQAALIAATVVEEGLITQLDHAAYLGRELAKAELAIKTGARYEQDAALGDLPAGAVDAAAEVADRHADRHADCPPSDSCRCCPS